MYLIDYLDKHHILIKEFAEQIHICPGYLSNIMHGKRPVTKKVARNIALETKGQVGVNEIVKSKTISSMEEVLFKPLGFDSFGK